MLAAIVSFAQEEAEPSKAPFYIMAAVQVGFALILAAIGIARHATFPPSSGLARALIALSVLLAAGTMFMAVITA